MYGVYGGAFEYNKILIGKVSLYHLSTKEYFFLVPDKYF
jgi:hypothetical protein